MPSKTDHRLFGGRRPSTEDIGHTFNHLPPCNLLSNTISSYLNIIYQETNVYLLIVKQFISVGYIMSVDWDLTIIFYYDYQREIIEKIATIFTNMFFSRLYMHENHYQQRTCFLVTIVLNFRIYKKTNSFHVLL